MPSEMSVKLMFASDIHGSALWCGKMLAAFEHEAPRKLFLLGDILYHGPRNDLPDEYAPKKVIELLNPLKNELMCVRGNCDTEVDQMVLDFPILQDSAAVFVDGYELFLSHGHHFNPDHLPPLGEKSVLINGHTHIPKAEKVNGVHCLNCGSTALPKENTQHSYMIYADGCFIWKALENSDFSEFMRYSL